MVFGPRRHASLMSLAAGLAVLPLAALAGIEEEAAAFTAERPVKVQLFEDLDLDGDREALLQFDADCDARGCPWALLALGEDGTASEVGGGRAQDISLVPTAPEGAVIDADSVLWAYTNGEFYPYF